MGHNWPVVILGGVFRAAGSGATLPPPPSPDESFRTSKKLPVHETCFYLRVFKVNLNQEKLYLAPSHSPPIRFSSAFLLSFLPPTSFLVPCAASSSLHEMPLFPLQAPRHFYFPSFFQSPGLQSFLPPPFPPPPPNIFHIIFFSVSLAVSGSQL